MTVKQNHKLTSHTEPVYFVDFDGATLRTNTASDRGQIGIDGFPVQYRQTINLETGACTCGCQGFQEGITPKAAKAGAVPSIHNGFDCKHVRKAVQCGREWGYIEELHADGGEGETSGETVSNFDYYTLL